MKQESKFWTLVTAVCVLYFAVCAIGLLFPPQVDALRCMAADGQQTYISNWTARTPEHHWVLYPPVSAEGIRVSRPYYWHGDDLLHPVNPGEACRIAILPASHVHLGDTPNVDSFAQ